MREEVARQAPRRPSAKHTARRCTAASPAPAFRSCRPAVRGFGLLDLQDPCQTEAQLLHQSRTRSRAPPLQSPAEEACALRRSVLLATHIRPEQLLELSDSNARPLPPSPL